MLFRCVSNQPLAKGVLLCFYGPAEEGRAPGSFDPSSQFSEGVDYEITVGRAPRVWAYPVGGRYLSHEEIDAGCSAVTDA